jgi:hypothetical protein
MSDDVKYNAWQQERSYAMQYPDFAILVEMENLTGEMCDDLMDASMCLQDLIWITDHPSEDTVAASECYHQSIVEEYIRDFEIKLELLINRRDMLRNMTEASKSNPPDSTIWSHWKK